MNALKIGIVEDDFIIAQSVSEMLIESGYSVTKPARRYSEAISMIEQEEPDLLLLDIQILGKMDGIDVARTVRRNFNIPFIFLTANADFGTIERAKEVAPSAFLAKPITKAQLFAAIEIAVASWVNAAVPVTHSVAQPGLFVKDGPAFRRVFYNDVLFAESRDNYVKLGVSTGESVMIRMTLSEFMLGLDASSFVQVHRSFVVAIARIEKVLSDDVCVGGTIIPVSKTFRAALLKALGIR